MSLYLPKPSRPPKKEFASLMKAADVNRLSEPACKKGVGSAYVGFLGQGVVTCMPF